MLKELKDFLFKGSLFEVAIGLILALAISEVVQGLIEFIVNPLIAAIAGKPSFDEILVLELNGSRIMFGSFLTVLLGFVITGTVLFFLLRFYNRGAKRLGLTEDPAPVGPTSEELLVEIRDELRGQRGRAATGTTPTA